MWKVNSIFVIVLFVVSTIAFGTFAQEDDHEEDCTVNSLLEHLQEYQDALDELVANSDEETILEATHSIGSGLAELAEGCGYHSDDEDHDMGSDEHVDDEHSESSAIDPHSIGDPENGEVLFNTLQPTVGFACATCHRVDSDETLIGPGLINVGNPTHDPSSHMMDLADSDMDMGSDDSDMNMGSDDSDMNMDNMGGMNMDPVSYIYTSITDPGAYVVPGFVDNLMPRTYAELFTEDEINDLIAYLISLSSEAEEHDE